MELILYIIIAILLLFLFIYINYKVFSISRYDVYNTKIPSAFDGFKILHLSDWHNTKYGKNNKRLIHLINKQDVDIIVFTGDLITRTNKDYNDALEFISKINNKPIYFSLGNHEIDFIAVGFGKMLEDLRKLGVIVLDNKETKIVKNNDFMRIAGMTYGSHKKDTKKKLREGLSNLYKEQAEKLIYKTNTNEFNILLSHDPLYPELYRDLNYDLVFSGHLHGGGIRLFGFGMGIPSQSYIITRLVGGKHTYGNTNMIVSRGLGNSTLPIRIFNRPELVITTLHSKTKYTKK